jgi:uncharacterized protein YndB with AHSA1/START domain
MTGSVQPEAPLEAIRQSVVVPVRPERAFAAFTGEIGLWWPLARHSVGGERARDVIIEPCVGGRILEQIEGGEQAQWGTVVRWEPPQRLAFTWHPGRPDGAPATSVEVTFTPAPGDATLVAIEHSGWERLATPAETRREYLNGWPTVIGLYAGHAAGAAGAHA